MDYALNVAENLKFQESKEDSLSLELEIEKDILNNLKNEVKIRNIYNIIEFLKSKRITSDLSDIAYDFRKLEVMPKDKSKEESILIQFVNALIYGPIDQAINLAITINNNKKIISKLEFEESKLLNILDFLILTKLGKLKGEFKNIDILKSILLGNISNNNRETIEESLIWNVYKIAKGYNLKALGRFIKEKALLSRLNLANDLKEFVMPQFI